MDLAFPPTEATRIMKEVQLYMVCINGELLNPQCVPTALLATVLSSLLRFEWREQSGSETSFTPGCTQTLVSNCGIFNAL